MKTDTIMELVAGYDTYAESEELQADATADAPATSPFCASYTFTFVVSQFTAKTIAKGC